MCTPKKKKKEKKTECFTIYKKNFLTHCPVVSGYRFINYSLSGMHDTMIDIKFLTS